jgi:mannose/fructose-specific phosphotransferase system component IIA
MDLGAPIMRRAGRVSKHNRAKTIAGENLRMIVRIFWAYTRKISAIASEATPIGSTGRAPDDNG